MSNSVEGAYATGDTLVQDIGVNHGGAYIAVAKKFLNRTYVMVVFRKDLARFSAVGYEPCHRQVNASISVPPTEMHQHSFLLFINHFLMYKNCVEDKCHK